jgi:small subunit ribosomal protein S6
VATTVATPEKPATLVNYECMFLVDSGKYASDPDGTIGKLLDMVAKAGGEVVSHRAWQDGRLAYEIEGQRKGLHYLVLFRMPGNGIKTLTRSVKLSELVLRHLVVKHSDVLFEANVAALQPGARREEHEEEEAPREREGSRRPRRATEADTEDEDR